MIQSKKPKNEETKFQVDNFNNNTKSDKNSSKNSFGSKVLSIIIATLLVISAISLSSLTQVLFKELWIYLGFNIPFISTIFSFAPIGLVIYLIASDYKVNKNLRNYKSILIRDIKILSLFIIFIVVFTILGGSLFKNKTTSSNQNLKEGYVQGCINGGSAKSHCECVFDKLIVKYGEDKFTEFSKLLINLPSNKKSAEEYIVDLAMKNNSFKEYVLDVKDFGEICR